MTISTKKTTTTFCRLAECEFVAVADADDDDDDADAVGDVADNINTIIMSASAGGPAHSRRTCMLDCQATPKQSDATSKEAGRSVMQLVSLL